MKTNKQLIYIHDSQTGSFVLDNGQKLRPYQSKVCVPKGTKLTHQTATGIDKNYHFVNEYSWAEKYYHHDLKYHGINVPKEFVEY